MEYYHDQFIGVYKNVMPEGFCKSLIDYFNQNLKEVVNRSDYQKDINEAVVDKTLFLETSNEILQSFNEIFWEKVYPLYSSKYYTGSYLGYHTFSQNHKIQKTSFTEGFHHFHCEHGSIEPEELKRILAYSLYLNDIEEGGETEFLFQKKRIPPKENTLAIFPAFFTHLHRGNPPLSNEKYILTGWISY